ncbi:lipopolysaccharide kinase InaA family protein [Isosphaeraceae bacterium EP7]
MPEATRTTLEQEEGRDALFQAPAWQWRRAGQVGWWFKPEWGPVLIGPDGLRLDEWRRSDSLTTIKTGPHRVVYRADLPEGVVFIKHFLVPDFRAILRQWFRRGKGRNEGRRASALEALGIPTITPIALGEQRKRRFLFENYLVTHAIDRAIPLDEFVERELPSVSLPQRATMARELAQALGILTARLHDAGLVHLDFHPGNILVRRGTGDRIELAMIDLDALRTARVPLNRGASRDNLALLNHYFWLRSAKTDRRRFLKAYLEARQTPESDDRAFAREIEGATRDWAERLWRRWGRRCRGSNKYFTVGSDKQASTHAIASRDLDPADLRALLADPEAPFRSPKSRLIKDSRTTTVIETEMTVLGRPTRVIYKRFNPKKRLEAILNLVRPSRAWRAWQAAQHLVSRALPTPQNLVYLSKSPGRGLFRRLRAAETTYHAVVKAEDTVTLGAYVCQVLPTLGAEEQVATRRRLLRELALLMRTLHERSLSHRDLKSENILVKVDGETGRFELSLIDLVGVRLSHPLPRDRRVQNLARVYLSLREMPGGTRSDILRFLLTYRPEARARGDEWKALWREVFAASKAKIEQNRRRNRPIS